MDRRAGSTANTPIETFIRVKNPDTNLRSDPKTNYPVVGIVQPGHMFPIVQTEGDWYLIQFPDQSFAYIASWIVDRVLPDGSQMLGGADSLGIDWGHGMTGSETVYIYHTHNRESWRNVASHTNGNSVDDPAMRLETAYPGLSRGIILKGSRSLG
ncbi:SH3 domain-containing protein [Brevibacillus composti]|uniref:SH3 domain-containing protein n=1 Tax=Brevibacillus composti TaxID=2796470 RepID=UPI001E5C0F45|nr:SH3 domain-containing protein [Brevibacillus composti]